MKGPGFEVRLPKLWNWSLLKYSTAFLSRGIIPDYVDKGPIRILSQATNQPLSLDWDRTRYHAYYGDPKQLRGHLLPGDVLINSTGTGTLGRVGYFEREPDDLPCAADGHLTIARADHQVIESRFLYYWLSSRPFYEYIYSALVVGATNQIELNRDRLATSPIALPPREEQRRIVDFLDHETRHLSLLAALRSRQRSVLFDAFRSTARELVLLGPGRGTVDTQPIEWFGPVNRDWPLVQLRRIGRTYTGTTFPHQYQGITAGDYPFVKVADFGLSGPNGFQSDAESWITSEVASLLKARIVPPNSVLYARVGAAMLLNQRRLLTKPSVIDDNVRALHVINGDPRYWMYVLSLLDLGLLSNPGPVPSVSDTQVSSVLVPQPPLDVQNLIGVEVLERSRHLDRLIGAMDRQIQLLDDRRQALITAAVTGQVDVTTARGIVV